MTAARERSLLPLLVVSAVLAFASSARAVVVYDLETDFSNVANPNGVWTYSQGNVLLTQFAPAPGPLAAAAANGYWGVNPADLDSSILLATGNGSTTGLWADSDFIAGEALVRTPSAGAPVIVRFTAPTNGVLTYSGSVWYADAPSGPGSNDFGVSLNAGPALESGSAGLGQDRLNAVNFVNGMSPIAVVAGDVLALELAPSVSAPFGSLAGVSFTIDFVAVPEPGAVALVALGLACIAGTGRRR